MSWLSICGMTQMLKHVLFPSLPKILLIHGVIPPMEESYPESHSSIFMVTNACLLIRKLVEYTEAQEYMGGRGTQHNLIKSEK